jgi:hypothetical protein
MLASLLEALVSAQKTLGCGRDKKQGYMIW